MDKHEETIAPGQLNGVVMRRLLLAACILSAVNIVYYQCQIHSRPTMTEVQISRAWAQCVNLTLGHWTMGLCYWIWNLIDA